MMLLHAQIHFPIAVHRSATIAADRDENAHEQIDGPTWDTEHRIEADYGRIRLLLDEAENERMHLMTFIQITQPSTLERLLIRLAQGIFFNLYFLLYMISPKTAHRVVGYLEEEAVHSCTEYVAGVDNGTQSAGLPRDANIPAGGCAIQALMLLTSAVGAADSTAPPAAGRHATRPRPSPPRAPHCALLPARVHPGRGCHGWSHTVRSSR
jgi:hypothetical protein